MFTGKCKDSSGLEQDLAAARAENERLQTIVDNLHAVGGKHRETANAEFHRANRLQVDNERLTKDRDEARAQVAAVVVGLKSLVSVVQGYQQMPGFSLHPMVAAQIDSLRAEMKAHPCHHCPDREEHARALSRRCGWAATRPNCVRRPKPEASRSRPGLTGSAGYWTAWATWRATG